MTKNTNQQTDRDESNDQEPKFPRDDWKPEPADLRDGETPDDDAHARRNAEQLAMATDGESEQIADGGERRDVDERVERTDVGASIQVSAKRGTGTRDQDEFKLKGKGATADDALDEFETMLAKVEDEYAERVRAIQPTEEDDA